jgi:signal transduction histidine kinase
VTLSRTQTYWLCQLGGWGAYFASQVALLPFFSSELWWGTLLSALYAATGLALTHAYRRGLRAWGWMRLPLRRLAPRMLAAALALSALTLAASAGYHELLLPLSPYGPRPLNAPRIASSAIDTTGLMLLWSVLYAGVHYLRRSRQAEIDRLHLALQMRAAKLEALELQLNPHFFFNSLNSVRALVSEDTRRAQHAITRLARLMRYALQAGRRATVPLRREMEMVRAYLDLEGIRFEERLRARVDLPAAAEAVPVPPMLLQTLTENAVKHGIAPRPDGGTVAVTVTARADGGACLRVTNPGRLTRTTRARGVGLVNTRERLRLLYGDAARLTLREDPPGTVVAEVTLPPAPKPLPGDARPRADAPPRDGETPRDGDAPPDAAPAAPRREAARPRAE